MSSLVGTLSGALVAGGVYYAFSNLIQTRTQKHSRDLHNLSISLLAPPSAAVPAPAPAANRIERNHSKNFIQGLWNDEIHGLLKKAGGIEGSVSSWGRKWLYGGPRSSS